MISVLIPTSPIPAHPSTDVIERALRSARAQLPDAPIVVVADGVRAEQEYLAAAYAEYLDRLRALQPAVNFSLLTSTSWQHQANMIRRGLGLVSTSNVLYLEHDTELGGEIPWTQLDLLLDRDLARIIRLSPYDAWPDYYRPLMLGEPDWVGTEPLWPTIQYSTWPHLAQANLYRHLLRTYFAPACRTMIEPVLHAVVVNQFAEEGFPGWEAWKLFVYAPAGSIRRCAHDHLARGDEPHFPMEFAYPGDVTPRWAPQPVRT